MNKELLEKLVNKGLETGADFSEIFYEDTRTLDMRFASSTVSKCNLNKTTGVGIRLAKDNEVYYADTNDIREEKLLDVIEKLNKNFAGERILNEVTLTEKTKEKFKFEKNHSLENLKSFKSKLYEYDIYARSLDERINQVTMIAVADDHNITIANSKGVLVKENRVYTRLILNVYATENNRTEYSYFSFGSLSGLETIDDKVIRRKIKNTVDNVIAKLNSVSCPGGEMPVIVGNGFGGVMMHEACGHAMEATFIADKTSILTDKLNQKIASDIVTVIDDGTIPNVWGSVNYDDEGNEPQKNILIENGILKNYLVDEISSRKLGISTSGSGRRQNFTYAPTSRMNNTYIAPSNSTVEEMISSIKYGLYAKTLGGGQVDTSTGDFTFSVLDAYMIRDGKIAEAVKGASLVGNTLAVLQNIEMVGNDFEYGVGTCGAGSGWIPVTASQPTIKLSKILVGGDSVDK